MSEYVTLLGAEDVRRAGNDMSSAAETIRQQVGFLCESLQIEYQRREEFLDRLETILREDREARGRGDG